MSSLGIVWGGFHCGFAEDGFIMTWSVLEVQSHGNTSKWSLLVYTHTLSNALWGTHRSWLKTQWSQPLMWQTAVGWRFFSSDQFLQYSMLGKFLWLHKNFPIQGTNVVGESVCPLLSHCGAVLNLIKDCWQVSIGDHLLHNVLSFLRGETTMWGLSPCTVQISTLW